MKRLLTLLVVLALAGYLGFKAAVWWLADQRFGEADQAVDEIGVIDQGSIRSGLAGTLTLVDAGYEDFRLTRPLRVGRLTFNAGSPMALLNVLLDPSAMPPQWTLQARGLSMALDETLFRNWVTATEEIRAPALFAPVCGPDHRQQLGSGDLLRLGITGVTGEALARQDGNELYAEITTAETGSLELVWPGARFNPLEPAAVLTSSARPVTLTLRDEGLMRRISAYCAREAGLELSQWTRTVMDAFGRALAARGFGASDQMVALYRQWLTEGGELTIRLAPRQALWGIPVRAPGPETADVRPEAGADPFITYNGSIVPDVFLIPAEPEPAPVPEEAMVPLVDNAEIREPGWQAADPENAAALVGQTVRVTLENGKVVEGRLDGIDEKRMEVVRLMNGGEVAYPIAIRLITSLEVWNRGQNP